jgi:hypothetical protein
VLSGVVCARVPSGGHVHARSVAITCGVAHDRARAVVAARLARWLAMALTSPQRVDAHARDDDNDNDARVPASVASATLRGGDAARMWLLAAGARALRCAMQVRVMCVCRCVTCVVMHAYRAMRAKVRGGGVLQVTTTTTTMRVGWLHSMPSRDCWRICPYDVCCDMTMMVMMMMSRQVLFGITDASPTSAAPPREVFDDLALVAHLLAQVIC